jgi:hypothetical protein
MAKTVTLRLDDRVYEEFRQAAEAENRPISNLIETTALSWLREQQFVDDAEMAGMPRIRGATALAPGASSTRSTMKKR